MRSDMEKEAAMVLTNLFRARSRARKMDKDPSENVQKVKKHMKIFSRKL